jgi:hypothetical protein
MPIPAATMRFTPTRTSTCRWCNQKCYLEDRWNVEAKSNCIEMANGPKHRHRRRASEEPEMLKALATSDEIFGKMNLVWAL